MLLQSLGHFKGLLHNDDGVIIDDALFKLHRVPTGYLLLFFSVLVTGKMYLGQPIQCTLSTWDFTKYIPGDMLNSYCYIQSTFIIPPSETQDVDQTYPGIYAHTRQEQELNSVKQSYYQWVPLAMFIQGWAFFLPGLFWKCLENGRIKALRMDLSKPCLEEEHVQKCLDKLTVFFRDNAGSHGLFGKHYLYSILVSLLNLFVQICFTNWFLGGKFIWYGVTYLKTRGEESSTPVEDIYFPKMSKCQLEMFGPSGTKQLIDGICVLPLNIFHDKLYLLLWFWYFILTILTLMNIMYWSWHCWNPRYRIKHIEWHLNGHPRGNRLKPFNTTFGDWLLLHLMYKNMDPSYFVRLISKLCGVQKKDILKRDMTFVSFKSGGDDTLDDPDGLVNEC